MNSAVSPRLMTPLVTVDTNQTIGLHLHTPNYYIY